MAFLWVVLAAGFACAFGTRETGWETYSLGDCFKFGDSWRCPYDMYKERWPHSLATEFLDRVAGRELPPEEERLAIIAELATRRTTRRAALPGECAVHLRLGDVVDNSEQSVDAMWDHQTQYVGPTGDRREYVYPREYYKRALQTLKPQRVVLVAMLNHYDGILAEHDRIDGIKSLAYLHRVHAFWEDALGHANVTLAINERPDDAFLRMLTSSCFVPGGGGFSEYVVDIRKLRTS